MGLNGLVHRLAYNGDVVALKMGRQLPAHFQRNPLGRGQLTVFPRCSLEPYQFRFGHFTANPGRTALKNSQLACGDITIICEMVH
jgi:hypothetical protein